MPLGEPSGPDSGGAAVELHSAILDPSGTTLIKQAIVVTGSAQGSFRGDILLRDGHIVDVGAGLDVTEAEIVDAYDYIVCAGFIDTHRHLWQTAYKGLTYDMGLLEVFDGLYGTYSTKFRPEDIYASAAVGRLTALDAGITTVLDWAHNVSSPTIEDAGIDALRSTGGRAVYGHGYVGDRLSDLPRYRDQSRTFAAAKRTRDLLPDDDALISSCYLGLEPPYLISVDACRREFEIARELGMRISVHINSLSGDGTPFPSLELMYDASLMGDDVTYVHLTGVTGTGLQLLADTGGTASLSSQLEAHTPSFTAPPTGQLLGLGVRPSLSLDSTAAASEDFFSQMRATFDVERLLSKGYEKRPEGHQITLEDIFDFATLQGARAIGQEHRLGSIEAGKVADLIFVSTTSPNMMPVLDPVASLIFHANVHDIDTVLVHGRPVKRSGRLLADLKPFRTRLEETIDYLYWDAAAMTAPVRPHPATRSRQTR